MNENGKRRRPSAVAKDLVVICVGLVAVFALAIQLELLDHFTRWPTTHDEC